MWRGIKASRKGPSVSHLFFADDLTLFAEVGDDQISYIREGLKLFCRAPGQRINYTKYLMFVSPNIAEQEARRLSQSLGVPLTKDLGSYLRGVVKENMRSCCKI